jgi:hypothetical protein
MIDDIEGVYNWKNHDEESINDKKAFDAHNFKNM